MLTTRSADDTEVRAHDEGQGPAVLVLHPGMDDGAMWAGVAARLAARFRVVRLHRRQYRLDLPHPAPVTIAQEVDDVLAVVRQLQGPVVLVGHSSGGVVALEALVAAPEAFAGAVLYEPPVIVGPPLGGDAHRRASAAIAAGRPGRAMAIFLRDVVRVSPVLAWVAGVLGALVPKLRALVPRQVDDLGAIDALGARLDAYRAIPVPTVLLGGDRSPAHLGERLDALAAVLPRARRVVLHGQGHDANRRAPGEVAHVITALAEEATARR